MANSERQAWADVRNAAVRALGSRSTVAVMSLNQIVRIADTMLGQLAQGIHENPALLVGLNPPRRRNPLPGRSLVAQEQISDRVYELAYRHMEDGDDYKHQFAKGVELWTVTLGKARCVVLAGTDGQDLWQDFL